MWEEFCNSDTFAKGSGSTVAKVLAGKVQPGQLDWNGFRDESRTGHEWCGYHFSQANWDAFGRLA